MTNSREQAMMEELSRLRRATEKMEKRQRFSWARVLGLLILILIGIPLLLMIL